MLQVLDELVAGVTSSFVNAVDVDADNHSCCWMVVLHRCVAPYAVFGRGGRDRGIRWRGSTRGICYGPGCVGLHPGGADGDACSASPDRRAPGRAAGEETAGLRTPAP